MSLFKRVLEEELTSVFLNLDEFAEIHEIEGKKIPCVVSGQEGLAETDSQDGFANVSGIGILQESRTVYCKVADLDPVPLPGQKIVMDDTFWIVGDGVSEAGGLLTLPLNRHY